MSYVWCTYARQARRGVCDGRYGTHSLTHPQLAFVALVRRATMQRHRAAPLQLVEGHHARRGARGWHAFWKVTHLCSWWQVSARTYIIIPIPIPIPILIIVLIIILIVAVTVTSTTTLHLSINLWTRGLAFAYVCIDPLPRLLSPSGKQGLLLCAVCMHGTGMFLPGNGSHSPATWPSPASAPFGT
jgi:hypothetical protein